MAESTRRLLIVFTILLVATAAWSMWQKRRTTTRERSFGKVDTEDVVKVDISGKGKEVVLELSGGRWLLTSPLEYPANQTSVEDLLEKAAELAVVNLVSSNPANHDLYEVGPETGVLVRLMGGRDGTRDLLSFFVGKMTSDFGHTYVRAFGSDDVYTATGLLSGYFDKQASAWRDRTILSFPAETIQQVEVVSDSVNYVLGRRGRLAGAPDAPWVIKFADDPVPVAADSARAAGIAGRLATLNASGFPEPGQEVGADWENPVARVRVTLTDGSIRSMSACEMPDDSNRWYLRTGESETVFLIYKSNLDTILRSRSDLVAGEDEGDTGQ